MFTVTTDFEFQNAGDKWVSDNGLIITIFKQHHFDLAVSESTGISYVIQLTEKLRTDSFYVNPPSSIILNRFGTEAEAVTFANNLLNLLKTGINYE